MLHVKMPNQNPMAQKFPLIVALLSCLLIIGVLIFKDYGISIDEVRNRLYGLCNLAVATGGPVTGYCVPKAGYEIFHSPFLELILVSLEKSLRLTEIRTV